MESLKEAVKPVSANILCINLIKIRILLLTHLRISNSEKELLLFGAFGGWKVSGQEILERVIDLVKSDICDIF